MKFEFHYSLIFFTIYLISITALYLCKDKRKILICNVWACIFAGIYFYINGGTAGVIACCAAAMGSVFQLIVERHFSNIPQRQYLMAKALGCTVFATIGIMMVYNSLSDLYLVVAIISCRSSEMLRRQDHIRLGYLFAEVLWMLYAVENDLALFASVHFIMTVFGLTILLKDYTKKKIISQV